MFSDIAFHSQKTKIFEATCYIILFFGSPAQGDGSSVKKLCEEVGKNFKPRLGRPRGRPRGRRGRRGRRRGKPRSLKARSLSLSARLKKALRQASVTSLGHGLQAEQRPTNEARHKRPLANKNDSCGDFQPTQFTLVELESTPLDQSGKLSLPARLI